MPRIRPAVAFLFLLTALLYALGVGSFLIFDSTPHLAQNAALPPGPLFQQLLSAILSFTDSTFGRPVTMFSFAVETALVGEVSPPGFRWTNIGIHLVNGLLVYLLIGRLMALFGRGQFADRRSQHLVALIATALWLLNPLHVSTVLYTIQRMTLLAASFTLGGLLAYLYYRARMDRGERGTLASLILAVALFTILATLGKENGILLLALVALFEWLRPGPVSAGWQQHTISLSLKRLSAVALCLPLIAVIASLFLFPEFYERWYQNRDYDVWERLATQARVLWHYVLWFVAPFPGWMGVYHDDIPLSVNLWQPWTTLPAILAWIGTLAGAVILRRRYPLVTLAVLFFLLGHALESTIIPLEIVFEHRNYLPTVGIALLLAMGLTALLAIAPRPGRLVAGGMVVIVALALAIRASYWHSEEMLAFTHYHHHPDSARSLYHFANETLRRGENTDDPGLHYTLLDQAYGLYERLDREDPHSPVAPVTLLYIDSRYQGGQDRERWLERIDEAMFDRPLSASDRNAIGLLAGCREAGWCADFSEEVLSRLYALHDRWPGNSRYHLLLSRFYLADGDVESALEWAQQALSTRPSPRGHYLAAAAASRLGRQALVYEHMTALQADDRWGEHHQAIKELFRHGRIAL